MNAEIDSEMPEPLTEDIDPTPWCMGCGARREADCDCGPIAENN